MEKFLLRTNTKPISSFHQEIHRFFVKGVELKRFKLNAIELKVQQNDVTVILGHLFPRKIGRRTKS